MKIAVVQLNAGANKDQNIQKAVDLVKKAAAARAQFILLPEVFNYRGKLTLKETKNVAESMSGPTVKIFSSLAKKYKKYILLGSIYEKSNQKKIYNTSVLINPKGKIQAKYRKIHLFDARIGKHKLRESICFLKGTQTALTKIGAFKVGLSICFDLRFPELYLKYAKEGADIFLVPSAFTQKTGSVHWKSLLRARAIEHQCYILAPNQIGKDGRGVASYGHSMIVHPWGDILAEASGSKNGIIYATLKKDEVKKARNILNMKR